MGNHAIKRAARKSERGATTTEMALLISSMVVVVMGAAQYLGSTASEQFATAESALAFDDTELAGACRNQSWTLISKDIRPNKDANGDGMICHKADIHNGAERNRYRDNDKPLS